MSGFSNSARTVTTDDPLIRFYRWSSTERGRVFHAMLLVPVVGALLLMLDTYTVWSVLGVSFPLLFSLWVLVLKLTGRPVGRSR